MTLGNEENTILEEILQLTIINSMISSLEKDTLKINL